MSDSRESNRYAQLGASSSKKGVHAAVGISGSSEFFCPLLPDLIGDPNHHSLLHADGAGTKSLVAYLAYKETEEAFWFKSLAQDSLVMNLDDVACVNAFEALALSNTIGKNSLHIPDSAIKEIIDGYTEVIDNLHANDISIQLCGGETADLSDLIRTLVVDSTLFARVKKERVVNTFNITAGDLIVGLSNEGQTTYELKPNSSIGSNGLTLARHTLIHKKYAEKYPEIVDPDLDPSVTYKGKGDLFDKLENSDFTLAEALLSPTRTYAPVLKRCFLEFAKDIHAAIHCTGGGQAKLLNFGKNKHYIKNSLFPTPAIFLAIQKLGNIPWNEMYSVFNMGHRMELICDPTIADKGIVLDSEFNLNAQVIGHVEEGTGSNSLSLQSEHGTFEYQ